MTVRARLIQASAATVAMLILALIPATLAAAAPTKTAAHRAAHHHSSCARRGRRHPCGCKHRCRGRRHRIHAAPSRLTPPTTTGTGSSSGSGFGSGSGSGFGSGSGSGSGTGSGSGSGSTVPPFPPPPTVRIPELHPQTIWAPATTPLTDAQALALVTPEPELRSGNATANDYVPTNAQLAAFYQSTASYLNDPLRQYVTGRSGIPNPTTDELIQWAAHKWGIPEDWIRADMVVESGWYTSRMGDLTNVGPSSYGLYPSFSRVPNSTNVYESLGVMQILWVANNTGVSAGTEPLRWQSTAFNLDFYASVLRWLYDGYTAKLSWVPNIYAGNGWNTIGGWYGCGGCAAAQKYIMWVQNALADKPWLQPGF